MPEMRNLIWMFDGDGRRWQRPEETDEMYVARRRRENFEDRMRQQYERITQTGWRQAQ